MGTTAYTYYCPEKKGDPYSRYTTIRQRVPEIATGIPEPCLLNRCPHTLCLRKRSAPRQNYTTGSHLRACAIRALHLLDDLNLELLDLLAV